MLITDPKVIRDGESALIESIQNELDQELLEKLLKDKFTLSNVKLKEGNVVVHSNKIAYKLELETKINITVIIDREGNYIPEDEEGNEPEASVQEDFSEDILKEDALEEDELDDTIKDNLDFTEHNSDDTVEEDNLDDIDDIDDLMDGSLDDILEEDDDAVEDVSLDDILEDMPEEVIELDSDLEDEDMQEILQSNKDFWLKKSKTE